MKKVATALASLALMMTMLLVPAAGLAVNPGTVSAASVVPVTSTVSAPAGHDPAVVGQHLVFLQSFAKHMGISTDQVINELLAGKSFRDIASAAGKNDHELASALRAATQDSLNYEVSKGVLTKGQESTIMNAMNDISDTHLINVFELMLSASHGHMGYMGQHRTG